MLAIVKTIKQSNIHLGDREKIFDSYDKWVPGLTFV